MDSFLSLSLSPLILSLPLPTDSPGFILASANFSSPSLLSCAFVFQLPFWMTRWSAAEGRGCQSPWRRIGSIGPQSEQEKPKWRWTFLSCWETVNMRQRKPVCTSWALNLSFSCRSPSGGSPQEHPSLDISWSESAAVLAPKKQSHSWDQCGFSQEKTVPCYKHLNDHKPC